MQLLIESLILFGIGALVAGAEISGHLSRTGRTVRDLARWDTWNGGA